ncbi:hypothetical protein KDK_69880 [Dictyobacter kobayashii]|uniref:Uncharacterized protein n=2 Tax=Dictyobacter kobayashii TaxID=2014872 RepID=A0A402AVQ3_9CHLR|nr:hypothetical protein KDK_69880 [Dictyobacter kobayashii]
MAIVRMGLVCRHHLLILHLLLASVALMMPVTTWLCVAQEEAVDLVELEEVVNQLLEEARLVVVVCIVPLHQMMRIVGNIVPIK